MPQEFQVLRCFQCSTFQVHPVKKALKWSCKLCGEKQSIIKVYGRGTGFECRQHVQKLNTLRGEVEGTNQHLAISNLQREVTLSEDVSQILHDGRSRWEEFVPTPDVTSQTGGQSQYDDDDDDSGTYTTDASAFLAERKSRKRKRKSDTVYPTNQKSAKWAEFSLPKAGGFDGDPEYQTSAAYTTDPDYPVTTETIFKTTINEFKPPFQPNLGNCRKNEKVSDARSSFGNSKWDMFHTHNLPSTENDSTEDTLPESTNYSSHTSSSTGSSKWSMYGPNESQSSESYSGEENCDYALRKYFGASKATISSTVSSCSDVPSSSCHEGSSRNMAPQLHVADRRMARDELSKADASSALQSSSKWGQFLLNDKENQQMEGNGHTVQGTSMQGKPRQTGSPGNVSTFTADIGLTSDSNAGLKFSTGEFNDNDFVL